MQGLRGAESIAAGNTNRLRLALTVRALRERSHHKVPHALPPRLGLSVLGGPLLLELVERTTSGVEVHVVEADEGRLGPKLQGEGESRVSSGRRRRRRAGRQS